MNADTQIFGNDLGFTIDRSSPFSYAAMDDDDFDRMIESLGDIDLQIPIELNEYLD